MPGEKKHHATDNKNSAGHRDICSYKRITIKIHLLIKGSSRKRGLET